MSTTNHKVSYLQFAIWAGLLMFVLFLLYQQTTSGMRLISLPGLFLSLGMLCFLSRGFCPTKEWFRRLLYAVALVLFALSLTVSARLLFSNDEAIRAFGIQQRSGWHTKRRVGFGDVD